MPKSYKILLSAYACEPNRGSEPGVGWHWALEIAKRGHEVWVLTRKNNQAVIESYFKAAIQPNNLHFIYYDLPQSLSFWKKGGKGVHAYYFLWQIGIYFLVKKLHKKIGFNAIHHITFVTIHQPSFLHLIKKVPFFYGPTGGGDIVPIRFLSSFPLKERIKEHLIRLQGIFLPFDPLRRLMFHRAKLVAANSERTKNCLPAKCRKSTMLNLAIGTTVTNTELTIKPSNHKFKLLFVGNFLHWKGLHLLIKAFNTLDKNQFSLTLIGKGKFLIPKGIEHIKWLPQHELLTKFKTYDLFVFPSYRDSGGMVVLEALSSGLPVIALDLGGPGQIVNDSCGKAIKTSGKTEADLIQNIVQIVKELHTQPERLAQMRKGAIHRAQEFSWTNTVDKIYQNIERYLNVRHE
jgi:glycosyltransferase involved in cell wall biosynthesis